MESLKGLPGYFIRGSSLKTYEFKAEILKNPDMDACYIEFPYDVRKEFSKGRVKVYASFDGYPYDGSLAKMGTENHIIGLRKDIRKIIKKGPGDLISVTIRERL